MSNPSGSKTPWLLVGALGCLALCVCIALVGGGIFVVAGTTSIPFLAQLGSTSAPFTLSSVTPAPVSTVTIGKMLTPAPSSSSSSARSSASSSRCSSAALAPGTLFNDDFGSKTVSDCNGWLLEPGENVDYVWSQNKYTFSINKSNYLGLDWPDGEYIDFAVETEAQPTGDGVTDYGIVFRLSGTKDTRNYYLFAVTSDGNYYVQERLDGAWLDDDPISETPSSAIKQGKTRNTVGVVGKGNTFSLYINHVLVDSFTDDSLPGKGGLGIFAGSGKTNTAVTFSRFTVLTPAKAQSDWK